MKRMMAILILTFVLVGSAYAWPEKAKGVRMIITPEYTAFVQPKYVTLDSPDNHVVAAGGELDGVAKLILTLSDGTYGCSGSLLWTGKHILTAAHCVSNDGGSDFLSGTAYLYGDEGEYQIEIESAAVHPGWDGDILRGNDVAVLTLKSEAPSDITRYDIDKVADDVYSVNRKIGFGISGMGLAERNIYGFGIKRDGLNRYDAYADTMLTALRYKPGKNFVPGSVLMFDFDDGQPSHDAFGFFFGISDLGLADSEVNSASGDSGGPTISNRTVVGITSYGITLTTRAGLTSDITPNVIDSSIGELSGDACVSKYASFIEDAVSGVVEEPSVPGCPPKKHEKGLC